MRPSLRASLGIAAAALVLAVVVGLTSAQWSRAANPGSDDLRLNLTEDGLALHGYDPVAYHLEGRARLGAEDIALEHDGAIYRFASEGNRARFAADPRRYEPAFGGFCSYGVRMGRKFDIDPDAFWIADGKLYVQLNHGTQVIWLMAMRDNIRIAEEIWPSIMDVPDAELAEDAPGEGSEG